MSHEEGTTAEEWRPVVGFDGYDVSSHGLVRSWRTPQHAVCRAAPLLLRQRRDRYGYMTVTLWCRGAVYSRKAHRLVLEAFVGPCPPGMETAHGNGVRDDNRLENLRWDTRKNNHADKRLHGTHNDGERNPAARLTPDDVRAIRLAHSQGEALRAIARRFCVDRGTVRNIARGQAWRDLPPLPSETP